MEHLVYLSHRSLEYSLAFLYLFLGFFIPYIAATITTSSHTFQLPVLDTGPGNMYNGNVDMNDLVQCSVQHLLENPALAANVLFPTQSPVPVPPTPSFGEQTPTSEPPTPSCRTPDPPTPSPFR